MMKERLVWQMNHYISCAVIFSCILSLIFPSQGRRIRDEKFVSSSTSSQWKQHVLDDLQDATAVTNGFMSDNDSEDTSMMGTKHDKKDIFTSTASYLAQGS